jgi:hypothetical protein
VLSDGGVVALFAGTPLVMLAGVVAIAVGTRTEFMIGPATAAILGLGALCFASARSVTIKEARRNEPTFQALARRFDGAVARNLLGDCVLRIAHPRGRVEVEYCVYSFDGESHTPSTRFALTLPAGALPRVRRDMLMKPSAVKKLGPATRLRGGEYCRQAERCSNDMDECAGANAQGSDDPVAATAAGRARGNKSHIRPGNDVERESSNDKAQEGRPLGQKGNSIQLDHEASPTEPFEPLGVNELLTFVRAEARMPQVKKGASND